MARDMVDNALFEVQYYGVVLNANRTYYLTRSQPPFLSSMIRVVLGDPASFKSKAETHAWLEHAYPQAVRATPRGHARSISPAPPGWPATTTTAAPRRYWSSRTART